MPTDESHVHALLQEIEDLQGQLKDPPKLKRLADGLPFGIAIWRAESDDPGDLRLLYANAEASLQWTTELGPLVGKTVREALPMTLAAPDAYNLPRMWQRVATGGQRELMPAVRFGEQGHNKVWLNAHAVPLGDRVVAAVHEDIGARMRAEQEIRELNRELERSLSERERRYRNIFNSASVALWETDFSRVQAWLDALEAQGVDIAQRLHEDSNAAAEVATMWPILAVNEAALRLFGARTRQDLPSSLGEAVRASSNTAWIDLLVALARGAPIFEAELELQTFSGDKSVLATMTIPAEATDLGNLVISMVDITERKRLERELWAAQRMESIGHLTGGVAHDFNNLLMVIGTYAGFLLEQFADGDPGRDDVKVIQEAADKAATLTNQLLTFSRRQIQQLELLSLNETVGDLEKMLRRVIGEDIELVTVLAHPLGLIKADRSQIEQVLMNLAVNAREAMPEGGKLTVETADVEIGADYSRTKTEEVRPGSYVMLAMTDTGTGMDEQTRLRIFEPFFSTKERGRGTGLGLSTVYGIVKQSKGYVWVYSEEGHGTTFKMYLPRLEEARVSAPKSVAPSQELSGTETVLLVEDEESVRRAARRILEKHGYRVLEASQGQEALMLCEEHKLSIHIVVTDVVMPLMNGRELGLRLAALRPGIKIVYVSGYAENAMTHQGVIGEGAAYVQKPFSPDALLRKIREVLDK
jgi:signal transduction histidine kinase/CheY-like chemotaxis protein